MNPKDNTWGAERFEREGGEGGNGGKGRDIVHRAKLILKCKFPKTSFAWLLGTGRQTSFS